MADDPTTDAKIAAAEARTDTKFAELRGELRLARADTSGKLDKLLLIVQATNDRIGGFETKLAEQGTTFDNKLVAQVESLEKKIVDQGTALERKIADQGANLEKKLSEQRSEIKADFRASRALTVALFAFVLAAIGLMFTVGGTMFSRGISVRDVVRSVIAEQQEQRPLPSKTP